MCHLNYIYVYKLGAWWFSPNELTQPPIYSRSDFSQLTEEEWVQTLAAQ